MLSCETASCFLWNLLQHRAQIGAGDQPCVPRQPAGLDVRLGLDVGGLAGGKLVVADGQVDGRIRNVDLDGVPFPDQTDGAAGVSWKSYTHVTMFDRPYPPEKQAEGLAISQAIVGGHCETCGFLPQCSTQKDFKFPVFAWCMRRKAKIMTKMEEQENGT